MNTQYGLCYRDLYNKHWWWRARERFILSTLESIGLRPRKRHSILDVGCGDGLFFNRLSRFGDVEGIEADATLISEDNPWKSKIHVGAFDSTFQPGKEYSLILMLDVLEHFADPLPALNRALDLMEPGGLLLITVPAFQCLWTAHDDLNHHFTRYTKRSLLELISKTRIRTQSCRYFFHWTFPVKLLVHIKERLLPAKPDIPKIPNLWLNRAMLQVSCLEQRLLHKINVPFGSSLMAVARRCHA